MGVWQNLKKRIRQLVADDEPKKEKKKTPPKRTNRDARNETVSSSSSSDVGSKRRSYINAARGKAKEEERVKSAFKAKPIESKPEPPRRKGKPTDIKEQRNINEGIKRELNKGRLKATATALKPLVDEKYYSGTKEAKLRLKQGEYQNDPLVAKYETAAHPAASAAARGGVSGASFGLSELLAAKAPKSKGMAEAEEFYQETKASDPLYKASEFGGEMAASLASFGLTQGASKAAIKKVAPKAVASVEKATAKRVARNRIIEAAARREATEELGMSATEEAVKRLAKEKAAQKASKITAAIGEYAAINMTTGLVSDINRSAAESESVGDFAKNMAVNAPMNIGLGLVTSVAPSLARSSGLDEAVAEAGEAAARKLSDTRGSVNLGDDVKRAARDPNRPRANIDDFIAAEAEAVTKPRKPSKSETRLEEAKAELKEINAEIERLKTAGTPIEDRIELIRKANNLYDETRKLEKNIERAEKARIKRAQDKVRKKADEAAAKYDAEKAAKSGADDEVSKLTAERDELKAILKRDEDTISEYDYDRLTKRVAEIDKELNAKSKVKAEPPEAGIVQKGEAKKTGKGERTEFRRGNEETAKEQARNRRTSGNKQKATQESFDKDYAEFEKTLSDAQSRISELKSRLRSAPDEEKAALKKQIDDLNAGVKSAYNRASLRYHPDRGGSNEWMGKFNETYDSFKRGSYSSRGFKSAESRTRTKTEAGGGGGGNTPPPRRAAAASGNGNFKQPRGKTKKATRTVSSVEDIVRKSRERTPAKEKVKSAVQAAKTKAVNSLASFEDANLKNVKTNHEKWKVNNAKIDKHRRFNALAARSVNEGQLKGNGRTFDGTVERIGADGKKYKIQNGKSLKQIYDGMDEATETAFDAYLLLKHAPDRIREGTPIFDKINLDRGNGEVIKHLNDPEVVKEEAERLLKEHPEFAKKAEEIYQYTRNELENRVQAGLLSQETASKWMHDHPFYVPTGRDGYLNVVHGNHKGVVGADSLKAAKGSDLDIRSIKEQLAEATARNWRDITANELLESFFGDKVQSGVSVNNGLKLLNDTVGLAKSADGRKYYAKIFRDGNMNRVEIDKSFYDGLEDLYKNGRVGTVADTVAEATSKFSGTFKKLVTSWNPIFLPKNFSRDFGEAIINTRQTKEFLGCLAPAWKELVTNGEYAQTFKNSGVSQANFVNLDETLNKGGKLGKTVDKFVALQDMTESFPRLAEYMATLKKAGVDISNPNALKEVSADLLDQAAANAADVTVNFSRSGSVGKNLNKGLVPFLNPSIQGWSKFTRNFREQKGTKQLLGMLVKATMLGAGANALNNFLLSDNPNYQQISARDKATNYIIAYPPFKDGHINNDTNLFIKIPQSRFAAVYGLPAVNAKNENKMGWAEMIKVARDQVLPVDPTESSIVAPLYQAKNNKTWYGAPIESDYLEENYAPSERYDANTSPIGKALGKATSKLPEELQISPKKADYLIDAATGVAGDFALPISTAVARGDSGVKAGVNVVKKAFMIDSTTQNNLYAKFSDKLKKATTSKNSRNADDADKAEFDRMNAYDTELKSVNRAIKELQDTDPKKNQKNIYEMQKVRNQMLQDAIDGKDAPSQTKTLDSVQKYVGTSYAIENFGSSADKEAMKIYGAAKYGDISDAAMKKKMDADPSFYKGVHSIGKLSEKLEKAGIKSATTLSKAVALASANADNGVFDAYGCSKKSRTESDSKTNRSKAYFKEGGSENEFVKLEKVRKTLGKLPADSEESELDKAYDQLKKGEISATEYRLKEESIKYNANISYIGLATSFAQANAPERGYRLYDIKDKNIQKGINLAAMGFTARDYREMSKALDTNGNGYPSKAEITAYVANSKVKDKATLYAALYPYQGKSNPFGTPTNYTRAQAAQAGKANGVKPISDQTDDVKIKADSSSGRSGYRRGYRRRGRGGGKAAVPQFRSDSAFKAKQFKPKTKTPIAKSSSKSQLAAALADIQNTEAKVKPPTPKGAKK